MWMSVSQIYAVVWMLIAVFVFAFLVGRMAGLLMHMNRFKDGYMQLLGELNLMMKDVALPKAQKCVPHCTTNLS
jgi:hypothetical protein